MLWITGGSCTPIHASTGGKLQFVRVAEGEIRVESWDRWPGHAPLEFTARMPRRVMGQLLCSTDSEGILKTEWRLAGIHGGYGSERIFLTKDRLKFAKQRCRRILPAM